MRLAVSTKDLKQLKMDSILHEVSMDYCRTMNKIIFDKYMREGIEEIIPLKLQLPPLKIIKEVPDYGMIRVKRNKKTNCFTEIFKKFCFKSLFPQFYIY